MLPKNIKIQMGDGEIIEVPEGSTKEDVDNIYNSRPYGFEMEDGSIVTAPANTTTQQVRELFEIQKQATATNAFGQKIDNPIYSNAERMAMGDTSLINDNAASKLKNYAANLQETARTNQANRIDNFLKDVARADDPNDLYSTTSLPSSIMQEVAGGVLDVSGQAFHAVLDGISVAIPDNLEGAAKEKFIEGWNVILNTENGQRGLEAIKKGTKWWKEFELTNPNAAQHISAAVNVGSLLTPVKSKNIKFDTSPTWSNVITKPLEDAAGKQITNRRQKRAVQLLSPDNLKEAHKVEQRGLFGGTRKATLSPYEMEVVERLGELDFNPKNSSIVVRDKAYKRAELERQKLEKDLETLPFEPVDPPLVMAGLKTKIDNLIESSAEAKTLGFDKHAPMFTNKLQELLDKYPNTPRGLLDARRELDEWARSMKGNKAFDVDGVRAGFKSLLEVSRKHINDEISISSPSSGVKKSLKSQSLLLSAGSLLDDKVRKEAATVLGRAIQNVKRTTGLSIPTTPLALISTIAYGVHSEAGLGIAASLGLGTAVYLSGSMAWKAAASPKTKKTLAFAIRNIDRSIKTIQAGGGYTVATLAQMRADRAYLQDLLQSFPTDSSAEQEKEKVVGEGEARIPSPL